MRGGWKKGLGIVAATACSLAMMLSGGMIASADDTTDTTGGYTFELGEPTGPVYTGLYFPDGFKPVDGGMIPRMPVTVGNLTVGKQYCVSVTDSNASILGDVQCARATATTQTFNPFMTVSSFSHYVFGVYAHLSELGSSEQIGMSDGMSHGKPVKVVDIKTTASLSGLNPVPASTSANVSFNYAIDPSLNGKVAGMCVYTFMRRTFTYDNPQGLAPYNTGAAGGGNPSYCDNGTTHTSGVTTLQTEHIDGQDNADNRVPDAITQTFQRFTQYAAFDLNKDLNAALSGSASFTLPSLFAGTKYGNWDVFGNDVEAQKHVDDPSSLISASLQVKFADGSYTDYMSSTNLPDFTTLAANESKPSNPTPSKPAPAAPVEKDLTDGTKNAGLLGTDSLTAGDAVSLNVGKQYAGQKVDVYLFSTPRKIASAVTVASDGTVKVKVPSDTPAGTHRIAVKLWSDPSKLVWDSVTVKAAAQQPGTNTGSEDNTAGTDSQKPTQPTENNTNTQKPQAKTDTLPKGGAGVMTVVAIMLVLAAAAGVTVVIRRRA